MRDDVAGPDGSALSEGLGPNAQAVMSESQKAICAALGAAAAAREQDLRGQYPKAARVLAEEVFSLRAALRQKQAEYDDMKSLLLGNARNLNLERERLHAALQLAVWAMRAPLDDWKGECERKALDAANAALGPNVASKRLDPVLRGKSA